MLQAQGSLQALCLQFFPQPEQQAECSSVSRIVVMQLNHLLFCQNKIMHVGNMHSRQKVKLFRQLILPRIKPGYKFWKFSVCIYFLYSIPSVSMLKYDEMQTYNFSGKATNRNWQSNKKRKNLEAFSPFSDVTKEVSVLRLWKQRLPGLLQQEETDYPITLLHFSVYHFLLVTLPNNI